MTAPPLDQREAVRHREALLSGRWPPHDLARALARHCLEEYANLAAIPPELYATYG